MSQSPDDPTTVRSAGPPPAAPARRAFVTALVALAAVALALAAWTVRDILLLVFGAVLVTVILHESAALLERWTPLGRRLSLAVVLVLLIAVFAGAGALFGAEVTREARALADRLPEVLDGIRERLDIQMSLDDILDQFGEIASQRGDTLLNRIGSILYGAAGVALNVVIVVTGAVYFAAQAGVYRRGLLRLLAPLGRARSEAVLEKVWGALRLWLVGQLMSMAVVGLATTAALWLLGVPSAFALGLLAGLAEFVPVVGPIASAVPAILIASGESGSLALWTAAAYLAIQQLESNVVLPLIQREMVSLPPALTVFSILAFGVLLGPLGVLFAAPLTVVAFVLVRELYPAPDGSAERSGRAAG